MSMDDRVSKSGRAYEYWEHRKLFWKIFKGIRIIKIASFGNDFAQIVTTPHPRQDIIRDSGEHKVIYLEM